MAYRLQNLWLAGGFMSRRRVQLVILCEDVQHRAFARGLFKARGFRNIRFLPMPVGKGGAREHIFEHYPPRVKAYRVLAQRNWAAHALAVFIDADDRTVAERSRELDEKLEDEKLERRQSGEKIALFIPKRNIETWLVYLKETIVEGDVVNEKTDYKNYYKSHYRVRDCISDARRLADTICPTHSLPQDAPQSLHRACDELERVL